MTTKTAAALVRLAFQDPTNRCWIEGDRALIAACIVGDPELTRTALLATCRAAISLGWELDEIQEGDIRFGEAVICNNGSMLGIVLKCAEKSPSREESAAEKPGSSAIEPTNPPSSTEGPTSTHTA